MPRQPRNAITGCAHHVTNRGNDRRRIFFNAADYDDFLRLLTIAKSRYDVQVFGVAVLPNHFHAVIQPNRDGALSNYLQWVLGSYASDLRARTGTVGHGHVFQHRFWSDPITDDFHFLSVLRYVEANPFRARLVERAEAWPWTSVTLREQPKSLLLDQLPMPLPSRWLDVVNHEQSRAMLDEIRWPNGRRRPVETIGLIRP